MIRRGKLEYRGFFALRKVEVQAEVEVEERIRRGLGLVRGPGA
jgi:hypothetical protein